MKKLYGLLIGCTLTLTACSDDSATSAQNGIGTHSYAKEAHFEMSGCRNHGLDLAKMEAINETIDAITGDETQELKEIELVEENGSYKIVFENVPEQCGFDGMITTERFGNELKIDIKDTSFAQTDCMCHFDFTIDIDPNDADVETIFFRYETYKVIRPTDPCSKNPEQNTNPACTIPGNRFKISNCNADEAYSQDRPEATEALLFEKDGSFKIELQHQVINCGFNGSLSTITMSQHGDSLQATMHMNTYPTACMSSCTLTFDITPEQAATATTFGAHGFSYGSGILNVVKEYSQDTSEHVPDSTSKLAKTNQYGMALGKCKESTESLALTKTDANSPKAYFIHEGSKSQIMIPDVNDYCDVQGGYEITSDGNTLVIKYASDAVFSKCTCTTNHWFDTSDLSTLTLAKTQYIKFNGQTYELIFDNP